ncbi:MAG: hypothetical protein Q9166_006996 [cf. Caloplaca sp. 2 TL-2023]
MGFVGEGAAIEPVADGDGVGAAADVVELEVAAGGERVLFVDEVECAGGCEGEEGDEREQDGPVEG